MDNKNNKKSNIEFKYNKKGELEGWEDGKIIGKVDQTPSWLFPDAFKPHHKLTKFILDFEESNYGEWLSRGSGTSEDPMQFPYVKYKRSVYDFVKEMHHFVEGHKELGLENYLTILSEYNIHSYEELKNIDYDKLDARILVAIIFAIVRQDRLNEGLLLKGLKDDIILKCLRKLESLDNKDI